MLILRQLLTITFKICIATVHYKKNVTFWQCVTDAKYLRGGGRGFHCIGMRCLSFEIYSNSIFGKTDSPTHCIDQIFSVIYVYILPLLCPRSPSVYHITHPSYILMLVKNVTFFCIFKQIIRSWHILTL